MDYLRLNFTLLLPAPSHFYHIQYLLIGNLYVNQQGISTKSGWQDEQFPIQLANRLQFFSCCLLLARWLARGLRGKSKQAIFNHARAGTFHVGSGCEDL